MENFGWVGLATIVLVFLHGVFSAWQNERTRKQNEEYQKANQMLQAQAELRATEERERIITETREFQRETAETLARITREQFGSVVRKVEQVEQSTVNRLTSMSEKVSQVHAELKVNTGVNERALNSANNFNEKLASLEESMTQQSPVTNILVNSAETSDTRDDGVIGD